MIHINWWGKNNSNHIQIHEESIDEVKITLATEKYKPKILYHNYIWRINFINKKRLWITVHKCNDKIMRNAGYAS